MINSFCRKYLKRKHKHGYVHGTVKETRLFGLDVLELARRVREVVRVGLRNEPAVIRLLHEVFIALLLSKLNGIVPGLELQMGTLHAICRRLPPHKWVLPPMTPLQNIPIHSPVVAVPVSGLCSRLRGAIDSVKRVVSLHEKDVCSWAWE